MTVDITRPPDSHLDAALRGLDQAEEYVAGICFKTGPPALMGIELEWTVHHIDDPSRPLDPALLARALHPHTPSTLDPEADNLPLPSGNVITVEPGGQVEISTQPYGSLALLHAAVSADVRYLRGLLASAGLRLGDQATDPYRPPRRLLRTPRYDAMAQAFARHGPHGRTMMCSTAALQVCLDAGVPGRVPARWAALHALGPVLLALFANSGGRSWDCPAGTSFADWLGGALGPPPTRADLDYHLSTLFPPVRPRGYVEVRYLDQQPPDQWHVPVALLAALFADEATVDAVRERCAPVGGRWTEAARYGLGYRPVAAAAAAVAALAGERLPATRLPQVICDEVNEVVGRRLAAAGGQHDV